MGKKNLNCQKCGVPVSPRRDKHNVLFYVKYCDECFKKYKSENKCWSTALEKAVQNQWKLFEKPRKGLKIAMGKNHFNSLSCVLISPSNVRYEVTNIRDWVRTHENLFNPEDVTWKSRFTHSKIKEVNFKPSNATGNLNCKATNGLYNVSSGQGNSWKGWQVQRMDKTINIDIINR